MSGFEHLASENAKEWQGLRLPARRRLANACAHVLKTGQLRRSDIARLGEVNETTASIDIREIRKRVPGFLEYDLNEKAYRLAERS